MTTPAEVDARSLALHKAAARRLREDPARFAQVKATLERWLRQVDPASRPLLQTWQVLVDQGLEACLAVAEEASERGQTLRQASPLAGVLEPWERFQVLRETRPTKASDARPGQPPTG
jgi:hypothetical protein